jgi:hypothetical protein
MKQSCHGENVHILVLHEMISTWIQSWIKTEVVIETLDITGSVYILKMSKAREKLNIAVSLPKLWWIQTAGRELTPVRVSDIISNSNIGHC